MTRWITACALTVAGGCARTGVRPLATPLSARFNAVDAIVERGRNELGLPSVSLAIMQGSVLVLAKGYGLADHESRIPATAQTIYGIGSLSKQFTAAAILKLVEDGRVQLDAPVSKYLPEYPALRPPPLPTIRNLLLQNSGVPEWDGLPEMQDIDTGDPHRFELAAIVDTIAHRPLLYEPGAWWSYSNSNYTLLAAVIERVTGTPHDEYLARAFFDRLGLRSTGGCASERVATAGRRAVGYLDSRSYASRPLTTLKARAYTGPGGLCSTAVDLVAWTRALVDGRVMSADSFRQMTTAVPLRSGFTPPYGFGVSLRPLVGQRAVWHMGVLSGYMGVLAYLPEHDVIIATLVNARQVRVEQIVKDIARELLEVPTTRLRDLRIHPREAERLAGDYDDGMFTLRISRVGEDLFLDVPPAVVPVRLMYQGGREFATARPTDFRLRFEPPTGTVERVDWEWGELRAYGRRVR